MAQLQFGIQLHLATLHRVTVPELVELGKMAVGGGVEQIWVTDNLCNRNPFVVLAALATTARVNLGTAVLVPYFHNPVHTADAIASISELMEGRELSIGLARGNQSTANLVETPKAVSMLREAGQTIRALLDGGEVSFEDYPCLSSYFHFAPGSVFQLNARPAGPAPLYCGGNGPLSLDVGGRYMDGLIFGGTFLAVDGMGRLEQLVEHFDRAAASVGKATLPKVAEIKLSVSGDHRAARDFCKHSAGSRVAGLPHRGYKAEEIERLGVSIDDLDRFNEARASGVSGVYLRELVTDPMVDAIFVAGDPAHCRERIAEISEKAKELGFQQLMFSEFGPHPGESLRLLADEILPGL